MFGSGSPCGSRTPLKFLRSLSPLPICTPPGSHGRACARGTSNLADRAPLQPTFLQNLHGLLQQATAPDTNAIKAVWQSQIRSVKRDSESRPTVCVKGLIGGGNSLYHRVDDIGVHCKGEVNTLSKQSERAADQAQMNRVSDNV